MMSDRDNSGFRVQGSGVRGQEKVFFLCLLLSVFCLLSFSGCAKKENRGGDSDKTSSEAKQNDPVQHKVMSFDLEGLTEKGAKNWDVKGDSAESISETQIKMHNIEAKSYGEDSQAVITASSGVYDKAKNNVRLKDDVIATILSTQNGTKEVFGFPESTPPGQANIKKKSGASSKKSKTIITCDGDVLFDYQNNRVYFNKNVKVTSDDGSIDADKITIYLDPITRKIVEIVAEGSVKMVKGENVTYSEKATYVESEKRMALTGQPKIVMYQDGGITGNFLGASDASTRNSRAN